MICAVSNFLLKFFRFSELLEILFRLPTIHFIVVTRIKLNFSLFMLIWLQIQFKQDWNFVRFGLAYTCQISSSESNFYCSEIFGPTWKTCDRPEIQVLENTVFPSSSLSFSTIAMTTTTNIVGLGFSFSFEIDTCPLFIVNVIGRMIGSPDWWTHFKSLLPL